MSKEGLVFKGVDKEGNDVEEQTFFKRDYEKNLNQMKQNLSFVKHL